MSRKKENPMIRFILFVAIVWFVSKLAGLIFRSISRPSQKEGRRPKYGFTKSNPPSTPQMDFKDVKDAEFEDLPEKEKVPK